jgi:hypothetical protein
MQRNWWQEFVVSSKDKLYSNIRDFLERLLILWSKEIWFLEMLWLSEQAESESIIISSGSGPKLDFDIEVL